ncbi:tail fiber assembly protein [Photorhabdus temperata]|uniref:Caudovirales tail fiber assembly protein n=1 Tax=Photorhabdus temperata subsp. temperata Meg1 TaxID=1393735 RepID=A0A081RR89_PHOTE|nr:tail fiber assembly protein [Photorhabdus temperata]KER01192.1 Caudovirales tail fiber assembly protein [Photorhabdus temperata subsp. temperata Meg1]
MIILNKLTDKNGYEYVNVPAEPHQLISMGFSVQEAQVLYQQAIVEQKNKESHSQRYYLLEQAAIKMAPLQDAIDLDIATDNEITTLKEWKKYRVALNRIDIIPPNIEWPEQPE